jgi:hypothetical protein
MDGFRAAIEEDSGASGEGAHGVLLSALLQILFYGFYQMRFPGSTGTCDEQIGPRAVLIEGVLLL